MVLLTEMRQELKMCATRKQIVKLVSKHFRSATKYRCDPQLIVVLTSAYGGVECVNGKRENFFPFVSDEYVVLRTVTGCDLSIVGLTTMEYDIEITSDTVPSQQRKGYNTVLRAVAVIVAFMEGKALRSEVSNAWSAYTLHGARTRC